ncbi:MAG: hypothetical protein AABX63_02035 [Nanoarchaeota archaeon]
MEKRFTAYDYNADPTLNLVKKCADCGFKAVKAQYHDKNGKERCPCCKK